MAPPIIYRRLLPDPGEVSAQDVVAGLDLVGGDSDRPYLIANFAASADGRATVNGTSGALGDEGDRALFHALRERVDGVLAGTTTLAAENYGRILGKEERRERRAGSGRRAEPIACTITRSGRVPWDIPLFTAPEAAVVVFAPTQPDVPSEVTAQVHWEPLDTDSVRPLAGALRILRHDYGVETLLCEGGPTLFAALLAESVVDELFLTLVPKLVGGGDPKAITAGPPLPDLAPLQIRSLLERAGSLFLRYAVTT